MQDEIRTQASQTKVSAVNVWSLAEGPGYVEADRCPGLLCVYEGLDGVPGNTVLRL